MKIQECRACGAPIVWARHLITGRTAPLDAAPSDAGTWSLVDHPEHGAVYGPSYTPEGRHTSHFATCPDAATHRRPRSAA